MEKSNAIIESLGTKKWAETSFIVAEYSVKV